jgi:type III secretory pathway component EscT
LSPDTAPSVLVAGAALHIMRWAPITMISPIFGGPLAPPSVRIALAAGLGLATHQLTGGQVPPPSLLTFFLGGFGELLFGLNLAFLSTLPIEAARAGGRLIDTLRGATLCELHVPLLRQRETAIGDLLLQWLMVLSACTGADRNLMRALLGTFSLFPVGAWAWPMEVLADATLAATASLLKCVLLAAAPAAVAILLADLAIAVAIRTGSHLGLDLSGPGRAAIGLWLVAVGVAGLSGRLLDELLKATELIARLPGL